MAKELRMKNNKSSGVGGCWLISKKRKAGDLGVLDGNEQNDKRRRTEKLNPKVKDQCVLILERLIAHPYGRVFRNLPASDYPSKIKNPMDLGTIKTKLANNEYLTAQDFASDVKLTFSNGMLCFPDRNQVHIRAKLLDSLFMRRWKPLEDQWIRKRKNTASSAGRMMNTMEKKTAQEDTNKNRAAWSSGKKSQSLISSGGIEKLRDQPKKSDSAEENISPNCCLSKTVTAAISGADQALKKALHAAKQTNRFAEIMSKSNCVKADVPQEKEKLLLKKEAELKRQREKEREDARIALQELESTVEFEDNVKIFKELEMLSQCTPVYIVHGYGGPVMAFRGLDTGKIFNPLAQLGLYIKEELVADDEATSLSCEAEEGEILEQ
ncbi:hypothetical protein ACH5RR_002911 [Cinchona calisaya]|uniref:Bromo domain-containing protein n=1 Tax=Cinchona calisaya TaxID=153742 RepID=A0ABD3ATB9_9GENT